MRDDMDLDGLSILDEFFAIYFVSEEHALPPRKEHGSVDDILCTRGFKIV